MKATVQQARSGPTMHDLSKSGVDTIPTAACTASHSSVRRPVPTQLSPFWEAEAGPLSGPAAHDPIVLKNSATGFRRQHPNSGRLLRATMIHAIEIW
jgi:hypothetical protein